MPSDNVPTNPTSPADPAVSGTPTPTSGASTGNAGFTVAAEIGVAIATATGIAELLAVLRRHLKWLLPAARVTLYLVEADGEHYRVVVIQPTGADAAGPVYPIEQGIAGWVIRHDTPLAIPDLRDAALWPEGVDRASGEALGMGAEGAALLLPLRASGALVGALGIGSPRPNAYADVDRGLINLVALQVAASVRTAMLFETAERERVRAEEAVRGRDEFLYTVSHDLKNPLASIKGRVQLAQQRLAAPRLPENDKVIALLAPIDATVTRMSRLIDDLLDGARLQAGQLLALDPQPTDLVALVRREVAEHEVAEHEAAAIGHVLHVDAPTSRISGTWDAFRLERVLDNLLANAVKYSPNGGDITVDVRPGTSNDGRDGAILQVRDKGLGIPRADLPHVFERFHRAGNVGRTAGTGIGLSGVRQIVEQHGGSIVIDSEAGVGTTVTVWLPLVCP